jgi:hypothetical protein
VFVLSGHEESFMGHDGQYLFEIVAAMEDDLHNMRHGAQAIGALAMAHGQSDVEWCAECVERHATDVLDRWRTLFAAMVSMRKADSDLGGGGSASEQEPN